MFFLLQIGQKPPQSGYRQRQSDSHQRADTGGQAYLTGGPYRLCVGVTVDNNGQSIPYFCVFSDLGQTVMIALSDDSGLNGLYFVQE